MVGAAAALHSGFAGVVGSASSAGFLTSQPKAMQFNALQMAALRSQAPRNFANRLVDYFSENFAGQRSHGGEEVPAREPLRELIVELVGRARSFGIETELGVAQFVVLALGYARDFDSNPRVVALLQDPDYSPDDNVQRVLNLVVAAECRGASCR